MTRSWRMFAGRLPEPKEGREFIDVDASERMVRLNGRTPVPVDMVEDPDGLYYGWIDAPELAERLYGRGDGTPVMIQPHEGMFSMQFPYGPAVEVERGHGEIVRMSCRAVPDSTDDDTSH